MDLDEALLHYQPRQIYEPGTVTSYSNYGTALAALIVERAVGKPFYDYVRSEIFEPLGMDTTVIKPDWSDNSIVAERRAANKSYILMEGYEESLGTATSFIHLYPAGSALGTLDDFMKFGRGLLPDTDESRALFENPETLTEFFSGSTFYAGTDVIQNSNGLWFIPHGDGVLGHGGNTQGYTSTLFIEPSSGRGLVVMVNEAGETSYTYGLLQEFFGDYQADPATFGGEPTSSLTGVFTNARMNMPHDSAKFARYMGGLLPLKADEETGGYRLMIGPGTLQHLGGDAYIMDSGNGLNTLLVLTGEPGSQRLQTYTGDNFKENTAIFILRWVSVALFFVVTLISAVAFVVGLIRRGLRALARRRDPEAVAQKAPLYTSTLMFHLVQVLLGLSVFLLLFMAIGTDVALARILAIVVGVLTLGLIGVWLIKPLRRIRPGILLTIILIISVGNVLYWRWFLA